MHVPFAKLQNAWKALPRALSVQKPTPVVQKYRGGSSSSTCTPLTIHHSSAKQWRVGKRFAASSTSSRQPFPDLTENELESVPAGMEGWEYDELNVSPEYEEINRLEEFRTNGSEAPIEDKDLIATDVRTLERSRFIWFVGRVASKRVDNYRLWDAIDDTVLAMDNIEPSEATRLLQAYAYGPKEVGTAGFEKLLKCVPANIEKFKDEQIVRLVYAVCKRGASFPKQFDFFLSEVLERLTRMRGHQLMRIASALEFAHGIDPDMLVLLSKQILKYTTTLNPPQFAQYVRLLVKLNLHTNSAVVDKLNTVYKKRLRRWKDPQWILESGMPLFLHDIMKSSTLTTWLQQLSLLKLPIEGRSTIATSNVAQMMIVDLVLRYDRTVLLNDKAKHLLEQVRERELEPAETNSLFELPFVFADLVQICDELRVLLHPVIVGPYYLELADPLSKRVVEWDCNWERYPPYRRLEMQDYATRKHRYLHHLGWTTLTIPLLQFYNLGASEQRAYVHEFVHEHKLPRCLP